MSTTITVATVSLQLQVAMDAAPNRQRQEAFTRLVNNMRAAGETDKSIIVALTGAIRDGLMYGNWPE